MDLTDEISVRVCYPILAYIPTLAMFTTITECFSFAQRATSTLGGLAGARAVVTLGVGHRITRIDAAIICMYRTCHSVSYFSADCMEDARLGIPCFVKLSMFM